MKRFVFKLQSLLNIKCVQEKEQKAKLMECDALLNALRNELDGLLADFEKMRGDFRRESERGMQVSHMLDYRNGFEHLIELTRKKRDEIAAAEKERLKLQLELVEIMREIKVYENLKEKQYEEYLKEVRLEEDKMIGDLLAYKITTS